jgi:beta-galactosidase
MCKLAAALAVIYLGLGLESAAMAQPPSAGLAIQPIKLEEAVRLWDVLPKPMADTHPLAAEALGHPARYILYSVRLPVTGYNSGRFNVHNYSCMYVDHLPDIGTVDERPLETERSRRLPGWPVPCRTAMAMLSRAGGTTSFTPAGHEGGADKDFWFEILMDNSVSAVPASINTSILSVNRYSPPPASFPTLKWYTYPLAMDDPSALKFRKFRCIGACFYRARMNVDVPGDLSLDTSQLSHGLLWINGHEAGAFESNKVVKVPATLLKHGINDVIIFDMDGDPFATISVK